MMKLNLKFSFSIFNLEPYVTLIYTRMYFYKITLDIRHSKLFLWLVETLNIRIKLQFYRKWLEFSIKFNE